MCGIHGIVDTGLSQEAREAVMQQMLRESSHRGPDFSGLSSVSCITFGHNRLSIIDLSVEANQPMQLDQLLLTFNGEIYNYKEIRKELEQLGHRFATHSDTEVILHSYREWGQECVSRFLGMWAFAIWDDREQTLFCSRDRFGIKPFYYLNEGGKLYFTSEVKSLRKTPLFSGELNMEQLSRHIQMGWITFGEESLYEAIRVLEPGTNLLLKAGKMTTRRYWEITPSEKRSDTGQLVDELEALIGDSINLHLRSDVPLGATLSGGLDSSAIVGTVLSAHNVSGFQTFSVYYEGEGSVDERPFILKIEEQYRGKFKANYFSPEGKTIEEDFHKATFHSDFPLTGSSPVSQYHIMQQIARSGIKVVLSGQGADDYLGGYMHSYYRLYADYLRSLRWGRFVKEFRKEREYQEFDLSKSLNVLLKSGISTIMTEEQLYRLEYSRYYPKAITQGKNPVALDHFHGNKFDAFHYHLMTTTSLPGLLHYEDRNSMAASLESRVPFLDHRLVEFAFRLKNEHKINDGYTKWILRESMKKVLPPEIRHRRDKKGFVTPGETIWLRNELKHLLDIDFKKLDFLDVQTCRRELEAFKKGDNRNAVHVWRLASLNYWIANFH